MVAVSDTGHGMDSATRQNIFEPFFTTKQQGKGTGLGLATVYGMVKQSGGDIWVYSEPGQGTTFKLYFPRVAEPVSPGAVRRVCSLPPTLQRNRACWWKTRPRCASLPQRMLKQLGYTVLTAAKGDEAIELSSNHPGDISLLVTDVVMPNMSGRQVADALVLARPGLKVLFLSGYTDNTVVNHGILDSNVNFLAKPFSRETLARKISEILSR